ncbi:sporulation protein YtfJ [Pseudoflavonifractor sp. AF19-9AC]|uniref:GerW family sporulation protein n=1 Tax=Pseudoflavonifractor sp. AF19-9AC TaxID=2292244 RepID=UPI000E4BF723|nr:GerW family sporulation protein [Pseudoflavonifractor sp. AF19-9AC]RHR08890.1 sporulation protein YtfJ [Pseudoflavonifractor sp. AF19-9AC]
MEKNNPLSELMRTTLESVRAMADANAVVGTAIEADGVTLIPISRLSFGVAGGGTEFSTKKQQMGGDNAFGGGSGASAKLEPVAFLVIRDGNVKLLPVAPPPATTVDRVIDTVPEVVDKVTDFISKQQEKKEQQAAQGEFAD